LPCSQRKSSPNWWGMFSKAQHNRKEWTNEQVNEWTSDWMNKSSYNLPTIRLERDLHVL
jgi:hypothetical protein